MGEVLPLAAVFVVGRLLAGVFALAALVLLLLVAQALIIATTSRDSQPSRLAANDQDGQGLPQSASAPTVAPGRSANSSVGVRRRGVKALVIGADGRASTSKVQVVMWTFAVFYALVFLLVWGRSAGCDGAEGDRPACQQAAAARAVFDGVVGNPLQPQYYVLLGFPLAAAVAAKALTTGKVMAGVVQKTTDGTPGIARGVGEVIANDAGEADLVDFQYFAFNLVALAFFATQFLTRPEAGLPDLPATLIGLSGLSAATYTAKKALETSVRPAITDVIPRRIPLSSGRHIVVIGSGFGDTSSAVALGSDGYPTVLLDGLPLDIPASGWQPGRIDANLTAAAVADHKASDPNSPAAVDGQMVVVDPQGVASDPYTITLLPPPPTE